MDQAGEMRVRVDVGRQCLELWRGGEVVRSYPVSTSRFGTGFLEGSFQTPTGRFVVAEKVGEGAPSGAVFRSREATGDIHAGGGEEDAVLTRILWLSGLDPENQNTRDRFIYIHGTNREDLIGQPVSHGCVRMSNADVVDLFAAVPVGTTVEIT
jgi:lipoprotein-anchoring transpeptidase ErfK/SrfK